MKFNERDYATTARKHFKPLRTLRELAEEFGVTYRALTYAIARDPEAPKERLHHHPSGGSGSHLNYKDRWFVPAEVRRWWKSKQQEKTKC